jgi:hypothetical protein
LSDEIDKGAPDWAWVRSGAGRTAVTILSAIILSLSVALILWPYVPSKDRDAALVVPLFFCTIILWFVLALNRRFYNWIFPAFEITAPGSGWSGSRRIAYVASLAVLIVIGVIVNRIS